MPPGVLPPPVTDALLDRDTFERAWRGVPMDAGRPATPAAPAQLTVTRNSPTDFQDRQVYLWVDDESWGKIKYGQPITREIAPGAHRIRANNTLFTRTLDITAVPGDHVRVRCTNGMPAGGWLMLIFVHVTYLLVTLERET